MTKVSLRSHDRVGTENTSPLATVNPSAWQSSVVKNLQLTTQVTSGHLMVGEDQEEDNESKILLGKIFIRMEKNEGQKGKLTSS